jgi:hypothetical protein
MGLRDLGSAGVRQRPRRLRVGSAVLGRTPNWIDLRPAAGSGPRRGMSAESAICNLSPFRRLSCQASIMFDSRRAASQPAVGDTSAKRHGRAFRDTSQPVRAGPDGAPTRRSVARGWPAR